MPDYAALYDDYWSRPDRWRSHSFGDVEALAGEVEKLGGGSVLDVGCGMASLVLALRRRGHDARGCDVCRRVVDEGNCRAPGCFRAGSILDLPWDSGSFDTVVCTDVLEHLAETDVPQALSELHRVARRSLLAAIATRPDRDGVWHLTVRPPSWWRQRLAEAGFEPHPAAEGLAGYAAAERRRLGITESQWLLAACAKVISPGLISAGGRRPS